MPSRLARARDGQLFLERAVQSIRGQVRHSQKLQILIGIDAGAAPPPGLGSQLGVRFVESAGNSQAAALNAAETLGYGEIKLDTLSHLKEAIALYKGYGFVPISLYGNHPYPGLVCLGKTL